jgi:hypothetical protein
MYPTVPSTVPGLVAPEIGRCVVLAVGSPGSVSFASPKSRIFARPSVVTKMLAGFRSRWTIPF